jgi:prevent-host-death family protein
MKTDKGKKRRRGGPLTTVEMTEAKTRLSKLLDRVARGERILITDRGQPVAMLIPPEPAARDKVETVVREMLTARDDHGPTLGRRGSVRRMREDGRRF